MNFLQRTPEIEKFILNLYNKEKMNSSISDRLALPKKMED